MHVINGLLFFFAAVVMFMLLVRWLEKQVVFYPSRYPEGYWQPEVFGLHPQDIYFSADGKLQLHGWYFLHPQARGQILMCHGNAGNLSDRLELLRMLHERVAANIFIFDYRGYGRSDGAPSETGVYDDAVAAFDWLQSRAPQLPLVVHGHSLGSAVAIDLATRRPAVAGLILESPFTNARDMARLMFGTLPAHWLTSMRWASDTKIIGLRMPKLFLHGGNDTTVPLRLGQQLFQVAPPPKEFVAISHADHNNLYVADSDQYFGAISRLLNHCVEESAAQKSVAPSAQGGKSALNNE